MRKLILMAVASFLWKKYSTSRRTPAGSDGLAERQARAGSTSA